MARLDALARTRPLRLSPLHWLVLVHILVFEGVLLMQSLQQLPLVLFVLFAQSRALYLLEKVAVAQERLIRNQRLWFRVKKRSLTTDCS